MSRGGGRGKRKAKDGGEASGHAASCACIEQSLNNDRGRGGGQARRQSRTAASRPRACCRAVSASCLTVRSASTGPRAACPARRTTRAAPLTLRAATPSSRAAAHPRPRCSPCTTTPERARARRGGSDRAWWARSPCPPTWLNRARTPTLRGPRAEHWGVKLTDYDGWWLDTLTARTLSVLHMSPGHLRKSGRKACAPACTQPSRHRLTQPVGARADGHQHARCDQARRSPEVRTGDRAA